MDNGFEALYNERRNAISTWQGYHYQGMVALLRFLEELVKKFQYAGNSVEANTLKMKIEWIEDFILFENNEIKEIYQVKKTLTDENRKEVLNNFIIQFKIFDKEAKWVLAYDETKLGDLSLTKDDFDQCYKVHIKEKWLKQIALLESHYREDNYWEHSMIYRDYKGVLTQRYNYCLSEKDLSILKVNLDEEEVRPTFNEIRKTEFIDYEKIEI